MRSIALGFAEEVVASRSISSIQVRFRSGIRASGDGSDFYSEIFVFGVEGFLEIKLCLEADEEISGDAEAELDAKGEVGTDTFFLADDITELGFTDFHGFCGLDLGDTMMGNGIPDEGGSGV